MRWDPLRRAPLRAALALVMVTTPGCVLLGRPTPPPQAVVPSHRDTAGLAPFRRVILMPLDAEDGSEQAAQALARSIQAAITKRNLFEVIPAEPEELVGVALETRKTGVYTTQDLVGLSRRFGADGVLHGVLTRHQAYPHLEVGLRLSLLDCRTGRVPWATDVLLDGQDSRVADDVQNWFETQLVEDTSLVGYRKALLSPRLFNAYAAARVVTSLERALRPATVATVRR